jgi:hemerythrin-like domain-containing protein
MAARVKADSPGRATARKKNVTRKKPAAKSASSRESSGGSHKRQTARNSKASTTVRKKVTEPALMKALRAEHRHMGTVMHLFAQQLKAIEAGELVDPHVVYEIMHYMVTWPDRFHHPREDLIYARVAEKVPGTADDVDTLQREHDQTAKRGRALLQDIERWRQGEVSGVIVVKNGRAYIENIHEHMNVEEKLVFPRIEATLSFQDWRELAADDELKAVANSIFGPRVQRDFRNMARKLRRGMRRSVERGTLWEWMGVEAVMESLEVVSIALESARDTTENHVGIAFRESLAYFREAPVSAPLRCAANNARVTLRLLGEVVEISRETFDDLSRVNQERKDRLRLLDRKPL